MLSGLCAGGTPQGTITNLANGGLTLTFIGSAKVDTTTGAVTSWDAGNFVMTADSLLVGLAIIRHDTAVLVNSVTIGGASPDWSYFDDWSHTGGASGNNFAAFTKHVAAGTYDVTIGWPSSVGTNLAGAVGIWQLQGYNSVIPSQYSADTEGTVATYTYNLGLPANAVILLCHYHANTSATTWTGEATKRADQACTAVSRAMSFADYATTVEEPNFSTTATWTTAVGDTRSFLVLS